MRWKRRRVGEEREGDEVEEEERGRRGGERGMRWKRRRGVGEEERGG